MNYTTLQFPRLSRLVDHWVEEETKDKIVSFVIGVGVTILIYLLI